MEKEARKNYILRVAMEKAKEAVAWKDSKQEPISASAFTVLHESMAAINVIERTERNKKEKLIRNLQNYWRGRNRFVESCKREHIQGIISLLFGIKEAADESLYCKISSLTFQEIYLYYCYVERLSRNNGQALKLFQWYYKAKNHGSKPISKGMQQELQRQADSAGESPEAMKGEKKWKDDIYNNQKDMDYFFRLLDPPKYSAEEKVIIAKILKEYWEKKGKWEGGANVSKKQPAKIHAIKEILGE